MAIIHPRSETCAFKTASWGVGSFFVYLYSGVESPLERYTPSFGGGGFLQRPERVVQVVVGIEVSTRE